MYVFAMLDGFFLLTSSPLNTEDRSIPRTRKSHLAKRMVCISKPSVIHHFVSLGLALVQVNISISTNIVRHLVLPYRGGIGPKIRYSSILHFPSCLCVCFGFLTNGIHYTCTCAYAVVKPRLKQGVNLDICCWPNGLAS